MTEQLAEEIFRKASEAIDVVPPPVDRVAAEAAQQRRRRRRTVVAAVAAGAVAVALGSWAATRSASEGPDAATVTRATNPADIAWYADGTLHLDAVTVEMPQVTDLHGINVGAVYGEAAGAVGFVADDGSTKLIGAKAADAPLAVSRENGWAAWVESGGDGINPLLQDPSLTDSSQAELFLYDLLADEVLGQLDVPRGTRPIAIDQDRVYYASPEGEFSWAPGVEPEPLEGTGLLDVESATRVYGGGGRIEMVQAFFSVSFTRPGEGAELSPGGSFVLTRPPRSPYEDGPFRPVLYDARSGDRLPSGLAPDELAVDAAFGPNHTVSYLVARVADLGGGADLDGNERPLLVLRTCDVTTAQCHDIIPLAHQGEQPLLAH